MSMANYIAVPKYTQNACISGNGEETKYQILSGSEKLPVSEFRYFGKYIVQLFITQPFIYGVIVNFFLCHESLNYSTGH